MFVLSETEWESLRSQKATLKLGRGHHRKFLPYVFTEHGALMAAGVLNSSRAIEMSIFLVRTFVAMRDILGTHKELSLRLDELEARIERKLAKHDQAVADILAAIRGLMKPAEPKGRPIGFVTPPDPALRSGSAQRFIGSDKRSGDVARNTKRLTRKRFRPA